MNVTSLINIYKRLTNNTNFWSLVIVIFFGLLAGRGLLGQGYFNMHDDLQMMRQLEMEKCFKDFQIPCRWVPDMGYGFGFPLFNYYPPLPYLFGQLVRVLGFSFADTVKIVFVFAFIASGITMYFLGKEFFPTDIKFRNVKLWVGGILPAVFYIWAPYHAVDIYVRGAMNEAWALIWFPVILLTSYKLILDKNSLVTKWLILLSVSWFGILTSHNLMVLIFTPIFAAWCLIWIVKGKMWTRITQLLMSGILAFGLAAFFTLPVALESKYVQTNTLVQGYYEYVAHFATINQLLISRFWGYGPSVWLEEDKMSFQVGHVHWVLSVIIFALIVTRLMKKEKPGNLLLATCYMLLIGWVAAFMAHLRSTPIWQMLPPLKFVQFPWRFLAIVILAFSFISGSLYTLLSKRLAVVFSIVIVFVLLLINWNYFRPEHGKLGPLTDAEKFSGAAWGLQQTAGIYDYLPVDAKQAPQEPQKTLAEIITGKGLISDTKSGTNWASFSVDIKENSEVRINIFQYPTWKVSLVGLEVEPNIFVPDTEKWGRIHINLPTGIYKVDLKLIDTWPRRVGNVVSLVTWMGLTIFVFRNKLVSRRPSR